MNSPTESLPPSMEQRLSAFLGRHHKATIIFLSTGMVIAGGTLLTAVSLLAIGTVQIIKNPPEKRMTISVPASKIEALKASLSKEGWNLQPPEVQSSHSPDFVAKETESPSH